MTCLFPRCQAAGVCQGHAPSTSTGPRATVAPNHAGHAAVEIIKPLVRFGDNRGFFTERPSQ